MLGQPESAQRIPPVGFYTTTAILLLNLVVSGLVTCVAAVVVVAAVAMLFTGDLKLIVMGVVACPLVMLLFGLGSASLVQTLRCFKTRSFVIGFDAAGVVIGKGMARDERVAFTWTERPTAQTGSRMGGHGMLIKFLEIRCGRQRVSVDGSELPMDVTAKQLGDLFERFRSTYET